jgi:hypothetical protein
VVLSADPALALRITYTLQHDIPSRTLRLPRPGLSAPALRRATRIAANIFLEAQDAAEWNRQQDLVLDRCLRTFFVDMPGTDLYDPTGSVQLAPPNPVLPAESLFDGAYGRRGRHPRPYRQRGGAGPS